MKAVLVLLFAFAANLVSAFPLLKGLESSLAGKYPMESAAGIRSILGSSLAAAAKMEGADMSYIACTRDFSGCPSGFLDNGATCSPPDFYTGSCGELNMAGLTPLEKHSLAASCGASFPCMD